MSNPLAADQGKPCFFTLSWRFRAVMSTAKAWHQKFRRAAPKPDRGEDECRQGEDIVSLVTFSCVWNYVRLGRTDILYPAI